MNIIFYSEINLFCIIIILIILHYQGKRLNSHAEKRFSVVLLNLGLVFMITDLCWGILDYFRPAGFLWLDYALNCLYWITAASLSYFWFVYTEYHQVHNLAKSKKTRILFALPLAAIVVLTLLSPFFGFMFSLDKDFTYHRGSLFILQQILLYSYLVFALFRTGIKCFRKKYYAERAKYKSLCCFVIPVIIAGILQDIFNYPVLCCGIVIAMLQIQFSSMNLLVTADELTGINNRNQLLKFLDIKMESFKNDFENANSLFLFIMDVDNFKQINDNYGHIEGDEALKLVANTLKKICGRYNCFCSRYGGDEFIMVGEFYDCASADALASELNKLLEKNNRIAGKEYELQLSIGYAQYGDETQTIPEYIDKADTMLYEVKRKRKAGR